MSVDRKYIIGGGVVLLAAGFATGRFVAPDKIRTVEKVVTRTVEDTQSKEQIRVLTEQLETTRRNVHRERVTVARPDGTKETKVTTDIHTDSSTGTKEAIAIAKEDHAVRQTEQVVYREKLVERARPSWFAGPLLSSTRAIGAHVDRRIVGPVFLGAWGLNNGQFGLSLSLEF